VLGYKQLECLWRGHVLRLWSSIVAHTSGWDSLYINREPKWLKKLHQAKTIVLNFQSLSQHPTRNHSRHLQFTTRMAHRFLRTAKKRLSHSFHAYFWHKRMFCKFSFTKAPRYLKLLITTPSAVDRFEITLKLSPESPLNRKTDSCFAIWSTQNAFCSGVAILPL
jgi:hypothetical protein